MSAQQEWRSKPGRSDSAEPEAVDLLDLYIKAVQDPANTVERCGAIYAQQYLEQPTLVREDFCGTVTNCIAWLSSYEDSRLIGVDHDNLPLQWCRKNLIPDLNPGDQERIQLLHLDVLDSELPQADLILAMNSSFCVLKRRSELILYLRHCRKALACRGMLIMEIYAGPESQMTGRDTIQRDGFTATWEQESFNAVTNETITHSTTSPSTRGTAFSNLRRIQDVIQGANKSEHP